MIRTKELNKFYDKGRRNENHVLNQVNIELPDTGLVCILGESGSGKTTLLNCIGRLDSFDNGKMEFNGKTYSGGVGRDAERLRNESFAYVFQNYFLIRDKTVYENLMLALNMYDIPEDEKDARIDYVLQALDIKRFKKRKVSMLSGGQQQRVAIARAIVKSPEVIFADEPTGNLDEENTVRVMNILKRISKNCLVLLATHEKRIAEFYADRIITVSDGKIASDRCPEAQNDLIRFDDHDIYLDEYKKESLESDGLKIEHFSRNGEQLKISMIHEGGNLYLIVPDEVRIERIGVNSSVKIKEGSRPKYDRETVEKQRFSLVRPKAHSKGTLRPGRVWQMAAGEIGSGGGRLAVPIIAMLLTAILCMFAVTDYITVARLDPTDFISTDSRVLDIEVERRPDDIGLDIGLDEVPNLSRTETSVDPFVRVTGDIIKALDESGMDYTLFPTINSGTTFSLEGFFQISELSETVRSFTYVPLDYLDEGMIIMGRAPENCREVVVDRWVLDKFIERKTPTAQAMVTIESFLDRKLHLASRGGCDVTIVGICDTGEPAIYMDYAMGLTLCRLGADCTSIEMLAKCYSKGGYDTDVAMAAFGYRSESAMSSGSSNGFDSQYGHIKSVDSLWMGARTKDFNVIDYFPAEYPADYAINRATMHDWTISLAEGMRSFTVYTNDKEGIKRFLNDGLDESITKSFRIKVTDKYTQDMATYTGSRDSKLRTRALMIGAILAISVAVLYVAMRGAALQRLREIAVYRLLGIKKRSIISIFAIQILLLSAISSLIGTFATAGMLNLLSQVKTMNYDFVVTWASVLLTFVGLTAANLITGILPVARLLKVPPAQLSAKYDL